MHNYVQARSPSVDFILDASAQQFSPTSYHFSIVDDYNHRPFVIRGGRRVDCTTGFLYMSRPIQYRRQQAVTKGPQGSITNTCFSSLCKCYQQQKIKKLLAIRKSARHHFIPGSCPVMQDGGWMPFTTKHRGVTN